MPDNSHAIPSCPSCGSPGALRHDASNPTYYWECGAWARRSNYERHGVAAVVDYDADCDYRIELAAVRRERDDLRTVLLRHRDAGDCTLDACHACMAVDAYRSTNPAAATKETP